MPLVAILYFAAGADGFLFLYLPQVYREPIRHLLPYFVAFCRRYAAQSLKRSGHPWTSGFLSRGKKTPLSSLVEENIYWRL